MPNIRDSIENVSAEVGDQAEADYQKRLARQADLEKGISPAYRVAPALAHAADAATTLMFLKEGGKEKGARFLIGERPSTPAVLGLKAAQAAIGDVAIRFLSKKNKTLAKALSVVSTARPGMAAVGNMKYIKELRARRK